ncbi:hypothetical protein KUTeg_023362 [Tegillarca granosa]|uniref:B box-type domain-containing protein n=1 Tax=Tegillarca granosa TaxID=220873 RepID=A0ABQ9E205_TEGGR|nr:hypothetical protein KUTeg_023362 [Tegillarca granosa]
MSDINHLIQRQHKKTDGNIEMVKFVTDVTQKVDKYQSCDPPNQVRPPKLITRNVDDQELKDLFGQLGMITTLTVNPSASPVKIVSSFTGKQNHVVTTGNNQAWIWCWRGKDISLVTSDGEVLQNINTDFDVFDAAVSTTGDLLVTVCMGNKVKKLTRNNTFTDLYTAADDYQTQGITVTDTGNVLVVLYKNMNKSTKHDAQCPVHIDQKCEVCEINNTSYKCLNCDEMMCITCMKIYLKSKASKDHKMVSLQSAEIDKYRDLTEKKCSKECVTSGVHTHHSIVKVEDVIDIKQKQLSNIIRQTNEKSKKYQDVIKIITQNKLEFSLSIAKQIEEVKSRNKELKQKLDKIESDYIKELQNKDKENYKAMTELEQRLQGEMSDINPLIQRQHKKTDGNIEMVKFVTDVTQKVDKYQSCDPPNQVRPPKLITRNVDDQELKDLFGQLGMITTLTVNPSASPVKIVSSFTGKQNHVVTTGNNQAWIWCWRGKDISLVTSDGEVLQNINTDFDVFNAAVSTTGDLLVTVCMGNKVKKLTRNNTFTDLYTAADNYQTQGITVTDTGNVLVVLYKNMNSRIVEITTSGQHIRTIQHDTMDNKLLFDYPYFICSSKNGDIIVGEYTKVVVITQQGQKRFIYKGEKRKMKTSFVPSDVVTDKHGHIIISDYYNSVLHVLDSDGKFVQYLMTPEHRCDKLEGLDIDSSGRLWVCNAGNDQIFIIKHV